MHLIRTLRRITTTTVAVVVGLTRMTIGRGESEHVELKIGDIAPDFTLPASDGRTYRLADLAGDGTIVIAWFPKAFTGG